ncbi:MAG: hypothetical protein WBB36_02170 [Chitinophagales bacterium]
MLFGTPFGCAQGSALPEAHPERSRRVSDVTIILIDFKTTSEAKKITVNEIFFFQNKFRALPRFHGIIIA